ncbi:effector binding domain-containing protein [Winogradskyella sp. R77965]|uniref:effector binding domain-containing protein n=1 Tax=Winogradskyella sp. R77965 TaxID=3093872 RepID=UPI0037DD39B5
MKNKIKLNAFIVILLICFNKVYACSIFCAAKHGEVLAAGNEDWSDPFTKLWTSPSTEDRYGSINIGHSNYQIQTAINEHGLFFDFAYIPEVEGKNMAGKAKLDANLFSSILAKCKTVDEALNYLEKYQYESSTNQILLADATGNSVVVNRDAILKRGNEDYQLITNFNACDISSSNYDCRRFEIINEGLSSSSHISKDLFKSLLSRTHQEGTHPTQYSYVFDLKRGIIHLYSFHNYQNEITINVSKELTKGFSMKNLKELFPIAFEEEYFRTHHKDSLKQSVIKKINTNGTQQGIEYYSSYANKNPKAAFYPFVLWDIGADLVMNAWIEESGGKPFDYWWHPKKYLDWKTNNSSIDDALEVFNKLENDITGEDPRQYIGVYEMKSFIYMIKNDIKNAKKYLKKTLEVSTEETGNYQRAKNLLDNFNSKNDDMEIKEKIKVIGISVNTTNENEKSNQGIGLLWQRFFVENVGTKITNKLSEDIYSIYTNYETDYRGKYTSILGYKVSSLDNIPKGLIGFEIPKGTYKKIVAQGNMPEALIKTWKDIWNNETINRSYTTDFEIHSSKSQKDDDSEVEVFISVK